MRVRIQPALVLSFGSVTARRLASLFLATVRALLISGFIFYASLNPVPGLWGMHYRVGYLLHCIGAFMNIPLAFLFLLYPPLRAVLLAGLFLPPTFAALPPFRFLLLVVPLYTFLVLARPVRSAFAAVGALSRLVSRLGLTQRMATLSAFAVRFFFLSLSLNLLVRYLFTPQFHTGLGAPHFLYWAGWASRPFYYLALLPSFPLLFSANPYGGVFYPSLSILLGDTCVLTVAASVLRFLVYKIRGK